MHYRQCHLQRREGQALLSRTTWLPEPYARQDQILKLKDNGAWTDGWKVMSVSATVLDDDGVRKAETAYRRQRKASDI
jgi:hypothetical protein